MSKRDKTLEMMRKGASWDNLQKERNRSASNFYEALRLYLAEVEPLYTRAIERNRKEEARGAELNRENERLAKRNEELKKEGERLEDENKAKATRLKKTSSDLEAEKGRIASIRDEVNKLAERGVTESAIAKVGRIDFGAADEILARVATAEKHRKLVFDDEELSKRIKANATQYAAAERELEATKRNVNSEGVKLDELRKEGLLYGEQLQFAKTLFGRGYSRDTLNSLTEALDSLTVEGQRDASLNRLVQTLRQAREMTTLTAAVMEKRAKLENLKNEVTDAKGALTAVKDTVLEKVREAEGEAVQQLRDLIAAYDAEVRRWGELKQEAGRYEAAIKQANILLGVTSDPVMVRKLPIEIVAVLARRMNEWMKLHYGDVSLPPTEGALRIESWFNTWQKYKITAVSQWLADFLTEREA
jgi:DNA repair exonuclease SbcCD ATPase subunit